MKLSILFSCFFLSFQVLCHSQAPLPAGNFVDWSNAGLESTIPSPLVTLNVLNTGGVIGDGTTDDGPAIQALIDNALPRTELYFPPGTYLLKNRLIMKSEITITGDCPSTTRFTFDVSGASNPNFPLISILTYQYGNFVSVTNNIGRGSTSMRVSNSSGFNVGSYAQIQQENDPTVMYTNPNWNQSWAQEAIGQMVRVTTIVGDMIYFSQPLNIDIDSALNPTVRPTGLIRDVCIKDLYIERLDRGDGHSIEVKNAYNCLIQNIESNWTHKSHINVYQALNIEIRDSYFRRSHDYGGGGHGYGAELSRHTTNTLVENNIFETLRHAMMVHVGANGNVFGYNYSLDPTWEFNSTAPDISIHGHYPSMNLFEGNIVQRIAIADYWGPSGPGNTYFRNRVEGGNIDVMDNSHFQNIVGNELTFANASISIASGITDIFSHGNHVNGTISWDGTSTQVLPASFYLPVSQFNNVTLPLIGPDVPFNSESIPAKERYDSNQPNSCGDIPSDCVSLQFENIIAGGGLASSQTAAQGPEFIHDGNADGDVSRWSRLSEPPNLAFIQFQLSGGLQPIQNLQIAWWRGDIRTSEFDIYVSSDGTNYSPVSNGNAGHFVTSGITESFEEFSFSPVMTEYIQIRGYGNSTNGWVSISEVEVYGNCDVICPETEIVNQQDINSGLYQSSQELISSGSITSPHDVRYSSPLIYLNAGFHVQEGAVFLASNDGCL